MNVTQDKEVQYHAAGWLNTQMAKVYGTMFLGILITAFVAGLVATSPPLIGFLFGSLWIAVPVILAPVALAVTISIWSEDFSAWVLKLLFLAFAALVGVSMSLLFISYSVTSLVSVFLSTAGMFAVLAGYGYFTKHDLSSIGDFLLVGLIAVLVAMLVNLFLQSGLLSMGISMVAVLIFLGLTAHDAQQIRERIWDHSDTDKMIVMGALTQYLNFLNLFVHLLNLFGEEK